MIQNSVAPVARPLCAATAVVLSLVLPGCAFQPAAAPPADAPKDEAPAPEGRKLRALKSYSGDPFVPINLYVNPDEHVTEERARTLEYAARLLRESGAFVRVDRGIQRWPITLQLRYWVEATPLSGTALSRFTFGMTSVETQFRHHLLAEVFIEPDPVGDLSYAETVTAEVPAQDPDPAARERPIVEHLLERMLADIAARKLIPRFSAYSAPPKRKEEKKPREHPA